MWANNLKIAFRNFKKHRAFSLLNILGLSCGFAASILILLWVSSERSYDNFFHQHQNIYRVTASLSEEFKAAFVPAPLLSEGKKAIPDIENYTRISRKVSHTIARGDRKFEEKGGLYVDSTFLNVFSFPLLAGDRDRALQSTDGIVITQEMANKYFGTSDVVGQTLKIDNQRTYNVVGVLENPPSNSHLQFDYLVPFTSLRKDNIFLPNEDWTNFIHHGYVRVDEHAVNSKNGIKKLEQSMVAFYKKHVDGALLNTTFSLQPLSEIHLHSNDLQGDFTGHGNDIYVKTLFWVAIFILVVASINFINLSTARSSRRSKEIGLRKVVGARQPQLIWQLLMESFLLTFISFVIAIALVIISLPYFSEFIGKQIKIVEIPTSYYVWVLTVAIATAVISGLFPAIHLSSYSSLSMMKKTIGFSEKQPLSYRNVLVVFQFSVSIFLLIATALVYKQLNYINQKDLGFNKENLIYVPMTGEVWNRQGLIKDKLSKEKLTSSFTMISDIFSDLKSGTIDFQYEGKPENDRQIVPILDVDEDFVEVYQTQLVAGRSFSKQFNDSTNFMINEKMAKIMGLSPEEAIGKPFACWGNKGQIVGVIKDFNFKKIHQAIEPLIMKYNDWGGTIVVRSPLNKTKQTIDRLQEIYQEVNPEFPFNYGFLDQDLQNQYESEQRLSSLFNIFAALGIFISCLGLYGLSAFVAEQRIKEIGIRKVLGSSVPAIVFLLTSGFLRLLAISIAIALPVSWYAGTQWLHSFAFHIDIDILLFVYAALSTVIVAILTVSFESIKAAYKNPIHSIKDE